VFGQQQRAAGRGGGGEDQRVPELELVIGGEIDRVGKGLGVGCRRFEY